MIDTVHFWFESTMMNNYNHHIIKDHLLSFDVKKEQHGSLRYEGLLSDVYKVSITERGTWVYGGSLAKYATGSNFNAMTITETKEAIEKLSDDIGLPMEKAKVTRLDVAANLDLSQRPEMYFPFLGNCQYYTRSAFGHSVLWSNKARAKTFYNKIQEATDKKKVIPNQWKDKNVGRFEIRYLNSRSMKYHLKKSILGKDLRDETFIIRLPEKMKAEYKAIGKRKEATGDYIHARTPKEIDDLFIREWIMKIGLDEAIQRIENSNLCPRGKRRAKERYRRLIQATGTDYPDLLNELDEKVQEAAKSLIAV